MNKLYYFSHVFQKYEAIPKIYNTETKLYMKEVHTLEKVFDNEGITTSEIATIEKVTQSAVSQKINKLETKGFIEKKRNPDEYKKINLFTTETGKSVCKDHKKHDKSIYMSLIQQLHLDEFNDNEKMLNKFIEILDTISSDMQKNVERLKKLKE
ncbi:MULTISPECIES: MarR family transcriptional regulator [Psychrilyobacter]|nr:MULTISPECIES: MarR family transcriptional regulator [Psychrilyobacter]NDI77204.1 MarR family transcriptional regulator [Psychrilyobacter piezotolerans]